MALGGLKPLLDCLSDGKVHSGESLGLQLGISRAAVWKQIRQVQSYGFGVQAHQGMGYCLQSPVEWLDRQDVIRQLDPSVASLLRDVEILLEVESTNDYVLNRFRANTQAPFVVLAETQHAGRGRRGRTWFSPPGGNLYFTLGWESEQGVREFEGLSLVVGLKIVECLQQLGITDLCLKWPNDVLWRARKLAGVLVDVQGDPGGHCQLAIGIGLNVSLSGIESSRTKSIGQPWADLQEAITSSRQVHPSRNRLVASLLNVLVPAIGALQRDGFEPFQSAWQAYDYCHGQPVKFQQGKDWLEGCGCGINSQGAYRVDVSGRVHDISGGEISLRANGLEMA